MIPSQSGAKRKADDTNPLSNAVKRTKKDNGASNKRKLLDGEEQRGGLVIVRAPPSRPPSSQATKPPSTNQPLPPPDRTSSRTPPPPPPHSQPQPSRQPPAKKFKASAPGTSGPAQRIGKERDVPATSRPDREVDEDVRQMDTEADDLRRQSRAHPPSETSIPNGFHLPPPSAAKPRSRSKQPSSSQYIDTILPLEPRETPQIEKNKAMRGESVQPSGSGGPSGGHRRRSSLSMRGKRTSTSFATTGVITHPHSSVGDASFYKHIDADLHESLRARQLMIWCAERASAELSPDPSSSSSTPKRSSHRDNGKDPPPLPVAVKPLFKSDMEHAIKMLAEKQIDTSVVTPPSMEGRATPKVRENEQNVKNRAREIKFSADIARAKAEEEAWREVTEFYNSHQAAVVADIERSRQARASAKAKGKRRADFSDDFEPRDGDLPPVFRRDDGVRLAREILAEGSSTKDALDKRIEGLPYKVDHLRALLDSSSQTTAVAETDLDQRFAQLSLLLHARTHAHAAPPIAAGSGSLASYLPPRNQPVADPLDIFRALSRIDMARPPGQVSDAARRAAREVQRAQEGGAGLGAERRLTAGVVAPPTPRKPPGTPRRSGR